MTTATDCCRSRLFHSALISASLLLQAVCSLHSTTSLTQTLSGGTRSVYVKQISLRALIRVKPRTERVRSLSRVQCGLQIDPCGCYLGAYRLGGSLQSGIIASPMVERVVSVEPRCPLSRTLLPPQSDM